MRICSLVTDENGDYDFHVFEKNFKDEEGFEEFVDWAVDMFRYLSENGVSIARVEVSAPESVYEV